MQATAELPLPTSAPLRILFTDLRRGHCRFPLWPHGPAPALEQMFFCGHVSGEGQSYCAHHKARCISPQVTPMTAVADHLRA